MSAAESKFTISVGAQTEQGKRAENQDNMTGFPSPFGSVYVVADGMGGHRGGAEASRIAVDSYRTHLATLPEDMPFADAAQNATTATNEEMHTRGQGGDPAVEGMGSTVVMAVVRNTPTGAELSVGHIGDSRAYLLRAGALRRLTRDHTAVQRLLDAHMVTPEEAKTHPDASVLTRALGKQPEVLIELMEPLSLEPGDVVLLCSDGLSGYVPDELIQNELLPNRAPQEAARALISLALRRGSDDNITVQILRVAESRPSEAAPVLGHKNPARQTVRDAAALGDAEAASSRGGVLSHIAVAILGFALGFGARPAYQWVEQRWSPEPQKSVPGDVRNDKINPRDNKSLPAAKSPAVSEPADGGVEDTSDHGTSSGPDTSRTDGGKNKAAIPETPGKKTKAGESLPPAADAPSTALPQKKQK